MSIIFEPVGVGSVSPVTGTGTTQKIFQSSLSAGGNYTLNALGTNRLNGKKFGVRMSGNAIGPTASTTLQLQLLCLVPGQSNVIIAQSTARTMATNVYEPWTLEAEIIADGYYAYLATGGFSSTLVGSQILTGQFKDTIGASTPAIDAPAILTNGVTTGLNMNAEPPLQFFAAVLFGTTNATNIANLLEFVGFGD